MPNPPERKEERKGRREEGKEKGERKRTEGMKEERKGWKKGGKKIHPPLGVINDNKCQKPENCNIWFTDQYNSQ